jgi:hypothetical protein
MDLILMLFLVHPGQAQPLTSDSLYFVRLTNGSTLYSNKVRLVSTFTGDRYLLLDSNRRIPLAATTEFKGWDGTFAVANFGAGPDAFRLQNEGRRISLYSQCYYEAEPEFGTGTLDGPRFRNSISARRKAYFFEKDKDGVIQRLNFSNLRDAVADNPASTGELHIAGVDLRLGIGLVAAGTALVVAGFIQTAHRNNDAFHAYRQASANWYIAVQQNPNTPMPTAPSHYGPSALVYIGGLAAVSAIIPLANVGGHIRKALDIYNGIE